MGAPTNPKPHPNSHLLAIVTNKVNLPATTTQIIISLSTTFLTYYHPNSIKTATSLSVRPLLQLGVSQVIRTQLHPRTATRTVYGNPNPTFSINTTTMLTFITTPNNPTGSAVLIGEIESLARSTKSVGGLLVIDEAYAEFSSEISAVTLIEKFPNIVVIRTMSKAFAFAGARVGYLVAHPSVIDAMRLVRLPYHLSALTQVAASAALEFSDELLATVQGLIAAREDVASRMEQLGLEVVPSCSNFLLFSGFKRASADVWKDLLDKGVLIRDVGLEGYLRVTIGNEAENNKFLSALKDVLNK